MPLLVSSLFTTEIKYDKSLEKTRCPPPLKDKVVGIV